MKYKKQASGLCSFSCTLSGKILGSKKFPIVKVKDKVYSITGLVALEGR
jgi:hypothetical protein